MERRTTTFKSQGPDATRALAEALAAQLKPRDVILLSGGVGAGKTHFARGAIQSILLNPEDVPSPTFTLVQTYQTARGEVWHTDLYRLTDPGELEELGLFAAFDEAICFVEWPDRLGSGAPENALWLFFDQGQFEDSRYIKAEWTDSRWTTCIEALARDHSN